MKETSGGIGVAWGLTFIFLVLKLIGYIDWPWLWVLSPLWIPFVLGFIFIIIFLFFGIVTYYINESRK